MVERRVRFSRTLADIPFVRVRYNGGTYESITDGDLKFPVSVTLSGRFEAGSFRFGIDNSDFTYNNTFLPFKDVEIWMGNNAGSQQKLITGLVLGRTKTHEKGTGHGQINLNGLDYRYILMKTYANETYQQAVSPCVAAGCETSAMVVDLMATYGQGLIGYSTYVEDSGKYYAAGTDEQYPIIDKNLWDQIQRFALEAGFTAYVDVNKELHFEPVDLTDSGIVLSDDPGLGEFLITEIAGIELDASRLINRILGRGDETVPILRQADSLPKQIDWGMILTDVYKDRNVGDGGVMKELIVGRLNALSDDTKDSYEVSTKGFAYAVPGQVLTLTDASYDISKLQLAVQSVTWTYESNGQIYTKFFLEEYPKKFAEWFKKLAIEITQLKGDDVGSGATYLDKLFQELIAVSDGFKVTTFTIDSGAIIGDTTYGAMGEMQMGLDTDNVTTEVDET